MPDPSIATDLRARDVGMTSLVKDADIPWVTFVEGVEMKLLRINEKTGHFSMLNRFAPGFATPTHYHRGPVHAYTLSGQWRYVEYDWIAAAGDYVYEAADTCHTLVVPEETTEPTVVLFVVEDALEFLDEDGEPMFVQDAESIHQMYRDALEEAGLPYPHAILQE